jgi:sensor histidine kinase YesM
MDVATFLIFPVDCSWTKCLKLKVTLVYVATGWEKDILRFKIYIDSLPMNTEMKNIHKKRNLIFFKGGRSVYFSIKYKYIVLYFILTIFPLVICDLLIYQIWTTKFYNNTVESQTKIIKQLNRSLALFKKNVESTSHGFSIIESGLLQEFLQGVDFNVPADLIITDHGKIVYSANSWKNDNSLLETVKNKESVNGKVSGNFTFKESGRNMLVIYNHDPETNLSVISVTEVSKILGKNGNNKKLMVYIIISSIVVSIFSIILISLHVTSPIRSLRKEIKAIENGDFNHSFDRDVMIRDEIWDIEISFHKIMLKLKEQARIQYQLISLTNQAKFKALQSQINPHFLHNALETINSLAIIHNVPLIAQISRSLSKMFRYNMMQDTEEVLIKDELDHMDNYLNVQLIRFDGFIECERQIDPQILEYKIIKFVLQPIVENCFIHGFKNLTDKGMIRIEGKINENKHIVISISDNGPGIPEEKLQKLNEELKTFTLDNKHPPTNKESNRIGIFNVNNRLKIAYGEEYGLQYHNISPHGLCAVITIPIRNRKQQEEESG